MCNYKLFSALTKICNSFENCENAKDQLNDLRESEKDRDKSTLLYALWYKIDNILDLIQEFFDFYKKNENILSED